MSCKKSKMIGSKMNDARSRAETWKADDRVAALANTGQATGIAFSIAVMLNALGVGITLRRLQMRSLEGDRP